MSEHWHLRGTHWLATLPAPDAAALRRMGTSRAYEPGEMIFGPSPDPEHVFVLDEGLVRIYSVGPEGHEITLGYVRPGELFGELAVVSDKARESFARAARPWRVLRIPKERFLETRL